MKNLIIFGTGVMAGAIAMFVMICEGRVAMLEDRFSLTDKGGDLIDGGDSNEKCN